MSVKLDLPFLVEREAGKRHFDEQSKVEFNPNNLLTSPQILAFGRFALILFYKNLRTDLKKMYLIQSTKITKLWKNLIKE